MVMSGVSCDVIKVFPELRGMLWLGSKSIHPMSKQKYRWRLEKLEMKKVMILGVYKVFL
ncbi:unnamed protein product, partial [Sphenostylis stenocarpa]